ncbi:MAG: hypothetical protein JWR50_3579 [Mucilaginibacter sp.]|nr:hypothetical protein [Mucilaginibacter sp.]
MKNKLSYLIIAALILTGLFINSCKKDSQNSIATILSAGAWQLSSVRVITTVGDTTKLDTTLNAVCDTTQVLTFNIDQTCTYSNFNCKHQPTARGHWSLTANRLFLNSDIVCQDTTAAGSSKPFSYAQIYNVGDYSLVLITGDIQNFVSSKKRTTMRYGFIRQKTAVQ